MLVNPSIKKVFDEIATNSVRLSNSPVAHYAHARKYVRLFSRSMTEQEQVYLLLFLFEMVHYRNAMTDPETLNEISNIRIKKYLMIFLMTSTFVIIVAAVFSNHSALSGVMNVIKGFLEVFSI
jgi:hypothetical protein